MVATLIPSDLVSVCVDVVVTIGIRKYDEQKALAGTCCLNAVTSLVTAGQRTGLGVTAGIGFALAIATKAASMRESMMNEDENFHQLLIDGLAVIAEAR